MRDRRTGFRLCCVCAVLQVVLAGCQSAPQAGVSSESLRRVDDAGPGGGTPDAAPPSEEIAARQDEPSWVERQAFEARFAAGSPGADSLTMGGPLALSGNLVPRPPHPALGSVNCQQLFYSPNILVVKFREGLEVYALPNGTLSITSTGAPSPSEVSTVSGMTGVQWLPVYTASRATLLQQKAQGEALIGEELPDLSLWMQVVVGSSIVDIDSSPTSCTAFVGALNTLNSLGIVETAWPLGEYSPPDLPALPLAIDLPPTTTFVASEASLNHLSLATGVDSPERLFEDAITPGNRAQFLAAYRGAFASVGDIEHNFTPHEQFNVHIVGGGFRTGDFGSHGALVLSTVGGVGRSGAVITNGRYGTRGAAPLARLGWTASYGEILGSGVPQIPEAIRRMAAADPDIVLLEQQYRGLFSGLLHPAEANPSVYDAIRVYTALGPILVEAAGNGNQDLGALPYGRPHSGAVMVAGVAPDGVTNLFNQGARIDLRAQGASVVAGGVFGTGVYPGAGGDYEQYSNIFNGTSSASAISAGVVAQVASVFEFGFGRRIRRADLLGTVIATGASAPLIGVLPSVRRATSRALAFGIQATSPLWVQAPHRSSIGITFNTSFSEVAASWSPSGRAFRPLVRGAGITLDEMPHSIGPLDAAAPGGPQTFTIEAFIRFSSLNGYWQTILSREYPRSYWFGVTPSTYSSPGRLHFSYQPSDTASLCSFFGTSGSSLADGNPHHVAVVFERDPSYWSAPWVRLYVDGTAVGWGSGCTAAAPQNTGTNGDRAFLGRDVATTNEIGDVRLHHRVLSLSELADPAGAIW